MDLSDRALRLAVVAQGVREAFADAAVRAKPGPGHGTLEATLASHQGPPTLQFLERFAGRTSALKLEAERWFWRASMLAAIEAMEPPDHEAMTLFSTVRALTPDAIAMLEGSTDYGPDDAQALRERFTLAQRVMVARFLRLVIEASVSAGARKLSVAYDASQAIAWCWTDDPESTRAAQDLRREARSYVRPPVDDLYDEAVIVDIEHAFADTPPPVGSPIGYLDEETSVYALEFAGADWRTLAPWFVDQHHSAFSFMTPAAFRYFLPAALCHSLGPGSMVNPDFHLVTCVVAPSTYRDDARARILTFSAQERAAVADFLRNSVSWSWQPEAYKTAVYDFWDPDTAGTTAPVGEPPIARETVAAELRAAFEGAETRPVPPFVRSELEKAFQQHPEQPSLRFLATHAHEASSLRPVVEQWFWGSFLLALLEPPWDHTDRNHAHWSVILARLHTAVALLTPRPSEFPPDVDEAQCLRGRCTAEQRVAVARFLRLVVEERAFAEGYLAYLGSQAIAECWSDDPVSTRVATHELRRLQVGGESLTQTIAAHCAVIGRVLDGSV